MSANGGRVKLSDDEVVLLIFGARRLTTKLRGDVRNFERKGKAIGLIRAVQRQLRQTQDLHSRLMDIARARGILERVTSSFESEST